MSTYPAYVERLLARAREEGQWYCDPIKPPATPPRYNPNDPPFEPWLDDETDDGWADWMDEDTIP